MQATDRASRSSVLMTTMFGGVEELVVRWIPVSFTGGSGRGMPAIGVLADTPVTEQDCHALEDVPGPGEATGVANSSRLAGGAWPGHEPAWRQAT
jgi:hypothetical protein